MTLELNFGVSMNCGGGHRPNGGRISLTRQCLLITSMDDLYLEHVAYFHKSEHYIRRIGELSVVISDCCGSINLYVNDEEVIDQLMDAAEQFGLVH